MNRMCIALLLILTSAGAVLAHDNGSSDNGTSNWPAWLERARESNLPLHSEAIESELWATKDEARQDALNRAATRARQFAREAAPRVRDSWPVPTWFVQDYMLREPMFIEEVEWTYGPMYRAHLLLDLTPQKRELILSQWHRSLVQTRLNQVGGGLGFLLVCVATLLSYLRLDDATRGYYSRWLATGAVTVVAGAAAALYHWIS